MTSARLLLLIGVVLASSCLANPTHEEDERTQDNTLLSSTEDQGRERRQAGTRRPGIFALLFQLIAETQNDTRSAYNQITQVVERSFMEPTPSSNASSPAPEAGDAATTTTEGPPMVSRQEFLNLLRRNLRGLSRLFNREVDMAVQDSNRSSAKARKDFMESLRPFLAT